MLATMQPRPARHVDESRARYAAGAVRALPLATRERLAIAPFLEEVVDDILDRTPVMQVSLSCADDIDVEIDPGLMSTAMDYLMSQGKQDLSASTINVHVYPAPALVLIAVGSYDDSAGSPLGAEEPDGAVIQEEAAAAEPWLASARSIVQMHDGSLWRDRSVQHGTRFLVALPSCTGDRSDAF